MSSRYLRPQALVGHVLVLIIAATCLRLGWWQWNVFEAARGTGQNLGYALLWPVFAGSFIYMWLRFLQLESTRDPEADPHADDAADSAELRELTATSDGPGMVSTDSVAADAGLREPSSTTPAAPDGPAAERRHTRPSPSSREALTVGMGVIDVDDDDDPELAAYNRALARLAEEDERRGR